jgi:hypothetical protein
VLEFIIGSSIVLMHMIYLCLFLDPHLTTHHSKHVCRVKISNHIRHVYLSRMLLVLESSMCKELKPRLGGQVHKPL